MLTIADAARRTIPEAVRERMIRGLAGYFDRQIERDDDFPGTAAILGRLTVLAALARHDAADTETLDGFDLDLELLPTSALLGLDRHPRPGRAGTRATEHGEASAP